jgi:hypothetical protein
MVMIFITSCLWKYCDKICAMTWFTAVDEIGLPVINIKKICNLEFVLIFKHVPQSIQDQKEDLVLENINSIFTKNSILKKEKKKWTCCYIMIWVLAVIFKVNPAKLRKSKKKKYIVEMKKLLFLKKIAEMQCTNL